MLTEEHFELFRQFRIKAMGDKLREMVEDESYDRFTFEEKMVSIAASSGGDSAMRQCANPLAIGARLRRQSGWESFCSQPFFELSVARLPRSSR